MTYAAQETSQQSGAPVELYTWRIGTTVLRQTSANADQVVDAGEVLDTFVTVPGGINRSAIRRDPERVRNGLEITVLRTHEIAALYVPGPAPQAVGLTIHRLHLTDDAAQVVAIWSGRVLNGKVDSGGASVTLSCESSIVSAARNGLGERWQRNCWKAFGSTGRNGCGVSLATYTTPHDVTSYSGLTLTLDTVPAAGLIPGGYVAYLDSNGYAQRRLIRSVAGLVLTLNYPLTEFDAVTSVDVTTGCDQTLATCGGIYNNRLNYGGAPYIADRNLYDGNPVL